MFRYGIIWLLHFGWQRYASQRLLGCWLQTPFFDTRFVRIEKTGRSASHTWGHGLSGMYTCSVNMYFQCSNHVSFWQTCLHIQHSLWPQISVLYTQWNKVCPQFLYHQSSRMDKVLVITKYQTIFSSKLMVISNHDLFFPGFFSKAGHILNWSTKALLLPCISHHAKTKTLEVLAERASGDLSKCGVIAGFVLSFLLRGIGDCCISENLQAVFSCTVQCIIYTWCEECNAFTLHIHTSWYVQLRFLSSICCCPSCY